MTNGREADPPSPRRARLAWLDALRGIAALAVVADHMIYGIAIFRPLRTPLSHTTALGQAGVFLFFLISGYIVPASLERRGDVRAFWISRVFRLYPVYLAATAALLLLAWLGWGSLDGAARHPVGAVLGHLLMLSGVLDSANAPFTVWTLSYEMVFYLLVTALFLAGAQRRSGTWALGFSVAALVLSSVLPTAALAGAFGRRSTDLIADAAVLAGLALVVAVPRRGVKLLGPAWPRPPPWSWPASTATRRGCRGRR